MTPDSMSKALRYRWFIFWILAFAYIMVYFHRLCPAVLALDMMKDLKTGGALIGFLGAAYFYPYALMQLPAGLLSDSWGPRRTITLFFCLAFGGSVLLALAPSVFWAIVGRTLVGIGVSMLFVPTMKILAEWFRPREFATMTGILMAMGGVGSLSAAAPLAALSSWIGWRSSFMAVGAFTLLLAILVWLYVRDRPGDFGWPALHESRAPSGGATGLLQGVKKVLTYRYFWFLGVWFFFTLGIFFSFGGLWGGPFFMQVYGLTKGEASRILSMIAVGMVIGSPLLSFLSDRVFRGRKPVIMLSSLILLGITALLAFYTQHLPVPALYLLVLGLGIFSSAIVVIGFTTAKELFPVYMAGTSTGLINLFPFAGGAVFQPLLGYILQLHVQPNGSFSVEGYRLAFLVLFGCAVVSVISTFFLRETISRER
ncbi:MAG: MFS transporter [Deltaproteobacteria bacterium]|nr:MFS transporter [Deltaproteobacteria bacterium]